MLRIKALEIVEGYVGTFDESLLEATKGTGEEGYRPYLVTALILGMQPISLVRVDSFGYQLNTDAIKNLLNYQSTLDKAIEGIPEQYQVTNLMLDGQITLVISNYDE